MFLLRGSSLIPTIFISVGDIFKNNRYWLPTLGTYTLQISKIYCNQFVANWSLLAEFTPLPKTRKEKKNTNIARNTCILIMYWRIDRFPIVQNKHKMFFFLFIIENQFQFVSESKQRSVSMREKETKEYTTPHLSAFSKAFQQVRSAEYHFLYCLDLHVKQKFITYNVW